MAYIIAYREHDSCSRHKVMLASGVSSCPQADKLYVEAGLVLVSMKGSYNVDIEAKYSGVRYITMSSSVYNCGRDYMARIQTVVLVARGLGSELKGPEITDE